VAPVITSNPSPHSGVASATLPSSIAAQSAMTPAPSVPPGSANQNPNTAAADILAKNPPPVPNLNLPINRVAPPIDKPKPLEAGTTTPVNKYAWLAAVQPRPAHLTTEMLNNELVDWFMSLNEKALNTLTPSQRETRQWISHHVKARDQQIQRLQLQQQQRSGQNQLGQQGQQSLHGPPGQHGVAFKAPPPVSNAPRIWNKDTLAAEIVKLTETDGKEITMDAVKTLCIKTNTAWTVDLERHLEQYCTPAKPPKTARQIMAEKIQEMSVDVTGEVLDEGMERVRPCSLANSPTTS
jgi:hypothetical protein